MAQLSGLEKFCYSAHVGRVKEEQILSTNIGFAHAPIRDLLARAVKSVAAAFLRPPKEGRSGA